MVDWALKTNSLSLSWCARVCVCVCVCMHACTCMRACIYICVCVCVCACVCVFVILVQWNLSKTEWKNSKMTMIWAALLMTLFATGYLCCSFTGEKSSQTPFIKHTKTSYQFWIQIVGLTTMLMNKFSGIGTCLYKWTFQLRFLLFVLWVGLELANHWNGSSDGITKADVFMLTRRIFLLLVALKIMALPFYRIGTVKAYI